MVTPSSVLNITREATLYLVPPGTRAEILEVQIWMLAIADSQNSFGPFAFGFLVVTCMDCDASLMEASKLQCFRSSYSNMIGFFSVNCTPIGYFISGDWLDLAPSGEFPTLNQ